MACALFNVLVYMLLFAQFISSKLSDIELKVGSFSIFLHLLILKSLKYGCVNQGHMAGGRICRAINLISLDLFTPITSQ